MQALELELSIDGVVLARAESAVHLQPATSNPLGETAVQAALGQLGDNSLALTHLEFSGLNLTEGKPSQPHLSIDPITPYTHHEPSFRLQLAQDSRSLSSSCMH